jgi:hypothetical protein
MGAGRIRTIKPQFWENEDMAELSVEARLTFIGLWCFADREGRLEDRPKLIWGRLWRYEPAVDVEKILCELSGAGFILRYAIESRQYIQVVNFTKHQKPNSREAQSEIPAPHENARARACKHEKDRQEQEQEQEQELREEKNPPSPPTAKPATRHSRLPDDFALTCERRAFALRAGLSNPEREFDQFTDHFRANGKPMVSWDACWRKWCRNAAPGGTYARSSGNHREIPADPDAHLASIRRDVEMVRAKRAKEGEAQLWKSKS